MVTAFARDFYDVLDVPRDATDTELKRAFRSAALECHPDKNPGDAQAEERFKDVNAAYSVLSDPQQRAAYDRQGHKTYTEGMPAPMGFASAVGTVLDGLLGEFFRGKARKRRGRDLRYTLELSFEEAVLGVTRMIEFPTRKECPDCDGNGARQGGLRHCDDCDGRGEMRFQQGVFAMGRRCGKCGGAGRVVVDPCTRCEGSGLVRIKREFRVKLASGVEDGSVTRVAHEGEPGRRGGASGDLHVIARVRPHAHFVRRGKDVHCDVAIQVPQAALGAEIDVPTVEGHVRMRIPAGTQSGRVFRIRQRGVRSADNSTRGDQLVKVLVETPSEMTPRQKELLREFARESGDGADVGATSFFDRVRQLLE